MPKFLIGTQDDKIRSVHDAPLRFSVSGRYVIDVPQQLVVESPTDSLTALLQAKTAAFRTQIPGQYFPFALTDEMLDPATTMDQAFCRRYFIGKNKRTALFRRGYMTTNVLSIPVTISKLYAHWYGFTLYSDPGLQPPDPVPVRPAPPRLLYNYDPTLPGFYEFNPADFTVVMLDDPTQTTVVNVLDGTHVEVASVAGLPAPPFQIIIDNADPLSFEQELATVTEVDVFGPNVLTLSTALGRGPSPGDPVWWVVQELTGNALHSLDYGPSTVRLRFVNASSGVRHLSDWILMHDNVGGGAPSIFDFTFDETFD